MSKLKMGTLVESNIMSNLIQMTQTHYSTFLKIQTNLKLQHGNIPPSNSSWSFPIVLVRKKNNNMRLCAEYRKLNRRTAKFAQKRLMFLQAYTISPALI